MSQQSTEIISKISIEEEMKRSYLDYAMSVIVSRALPDVRDGLKPVHRRILYSMYESGYFYNKQYRKSARVVGDVIGKYHPHGDAAIYDALVRMAQDFSMRIPLIDGQGNFGSIDGDEPAAMRYTEIKLTKISSSLLNDLDKQTVNFKPNYDNTEKEPEVLPALFPNLIINGSGGIAVGMATNIPTHNLNEVIDACIELIERPEMTIDEIFETIKGPDFPTAGVILGAKGIISAYKTGKGIIQVRGKAEIETTGKKESIIITEIPYAVNKVKMIERIAELVNTQKIEGISDLRDESDKSGIRVVVEIKKAFSSDVILNQLYAFSPLQTSFGINMVALDKDIPKLMNIKEILVSFLEFKEQVVTKRIVYLLNQARSKAHILFAMRIAVTYIDLVISMIRGSKDSNEAKVKLSNATWEVSDIEEWLPLIENSSEDDAPNSNADNYEKKSNIYKFTETQVKAILEMRLQRLTALESGKIEESLNSLVEEIKKYIHLLTSREAFLDLIKSELIGVKNEFGTERLTEIDYNANLDEDIEDLIQREEMVVITTLGGYIKRVPLASYRSQKRGGKGRSAASMSSEDVMTQVLAGSTHSTVLFFTNSGQAYSMKLYKLPLGNPQSKGRAVVNLIPHLKPKEIVNNILLLPENIHEMKNINMIFATSKGNIRRSNIDDFIKIPSSGKIAIRLSDDDSLINVSLCNDDQQVFISTKAGKSIRFPLEDLRVIKSRTSEGVRAIKLAKDDRVISMTVLKGVDYSLLEREKYLSIPYQERKEIARHSQLPLADYSYTELETAKIKEMADNEEFILSVTSSGFGKCSSAYEYRVTARGGKGITNMNISIKTGDLVSVTPINDEFNQLILVTDTGKLIRLGTDTIRITKRTTSGVILFRISNETNEKVVSSALVSENSDETEEGPILNPTE